MADHEERMKKFKFLVGTWDLEYRHIHEEIN